MDMTSFILYIKTDDIYEDIAENVENRFDTVSYELDRPLPNGKNKKVIGLMEDELTICSNHVTYAFQSESTLYSCVNVKELLA